MQDPALCSGSPFCTSLASGPGGKLGAAGAGLPRRPVSCSPRSRNHSSCISSVIRWCMRGREADAHHPVMSCLPIFMAQLECPFLGKNVLQQPEAQSAPPFALPGHLEGGSQAHAVHGEARLCEPAAPLGGKLLKAKTASSAWLRTRPVKGCSMDFPRHPTAPRVYFRCRLSPNSRGCHLLESEWLLIPQEQARHKGCPSPFYRVWSCDQVCVSSLL